MRRLRRAHQKHARQSRKFKRRAVAAGTAAVITLGTGISLNKTLAHTPDPHELPVSQDTDMDLLADNEEIALAYLTFQPDQNRNEIPDGVELAKCCATVFDQLPDCSEANPKQICKGFAETWGSETCDICGQIVDMGGAWVTNPQLGLTVNFPILAIHYLEHGSFSYAGDVHNGRVDVAELAAALELRLPYEPNDHQLPVPKDTDTDLLSNKEEFAIGYQPFNDDQNKNEIPDGTELAKRCVAVVKGLPLYPLWDPPSDVNKTYKIEHALDGTEQCHICGQDIHMGGWEIINLKLNLHYPDPNDPLGGMFLPDLALHYMEHGSFDCYGDDHQGRVNIPRLLRVLELRYPYDPNEHQLSPDANDLDGDLLTDTEELAAYYNLYDPDQNQNLNPDGIELANQCADVIEALPLHNPQSGDPPPKQTYKIEHLARGNETCDICAEIFNMGFLEIINPQSKLTINIPIISVHYMSHGSFSYAGSTNTGRVDIPLLVKLLEMPRNCGHLGTIYLPADLNKDCQENFADFTDVANKWLESTDPYDG